MKKITNWYLIVLMALLTGCSGEDSGNSEEPINEEIELIGTVWTINESGFQASLAFGNITGEYEKRVLMCVKSGMYSGLYKGRLEEGKIVWDYDFDREPTTLSFSNGKLKLTDGTTNGSLAGTFTKGNWTGGCNISLKNSVLTFDERKLVFLAAAGASEVFSIKMDNMSYSKISISMDPSADYCMYAKPLPPPTYPTDGSVDPYANMFEISYNGAFSGVHTLRQMTPQSTYHPGCNIIKMSGPMFYNIAPIHSDPHPMAPYIETTAVSNVVTEQINGGSGLITLTKLTIGGKNIVQKSQAFSIDYKGVCYSTDPYPTIVDPNVGNLQLSGAGDFSVTTDYLQPNTKYYFRSMISAGGLVSYGETVSFTTAP